ncbi:ATP-dependent RNA helicase DDX51 isoform X1 [Bombina bombina]|uniref:ATP-dependent RNA helicase DDX51 isoform X1 n=1 Tax=Bombina bombina TaxID=8345 RepID=UPI00235A6A5B|nr:ATP-dependent RNA helicase DDX51 isoform X1 [Bombina bombina]
MSLFVINRYLGDEAESSEDRSRALLEKLREQAKTRQLEKQESEKYKPTHGTDKKDFPIPSDEEVEKEKQKKSKKRKKKQNKEQREEVESSSSECEQKGESFPSAGKKKKKTNKLEEEQEGNNEDTTKSDNSREDNGCGEEKVDPDSIILGGFESKSIQKVMPVLPQWLAKPNLVHKDIKQNLVPIQDVPGLHPKILKKLEANKVKSFFPVQAEVIPAILESTCHGFLLGRGGYRPSDMCVSAPTGSGKTLAFVIPIVQALLHRVICEVRVLVVLPTKELAQQVCKVFNTYVDGTGLKVVMLTGQKSFPKEQETLVQRTASGFCSLADILVSTPGRLVDHIQETEGFSLRHLRFLVIDEADRMIDSMNQDWLHHVTKAVFQVNDSAPNILFSRKEPGTLTAASSYLPQIPLQKLLFSATLTQNPEKLQKLGLYQPRLFTSTHKGTPIDSADSHSNTNNLAIYSLPEGLTHYYVPCNLNSKPLILLYFLLILRFTRVLCFTNSREASHRLFLLFRSFGGISVAEFSSRLSPGERKKTLKEFEQGKLQILISTDATARGIDIKGVKCVINYDAPQFIRTYIHRVGRTARAGNVGSAFTMLLQVQEQRYFSMMRDAGAPEMKRQLVKHENLKQFVERYKEALTMLEKAVKDERAKKRS